MPGSRDPPIYFHLDGFGITVDFVEELGDRFIGWGSKDRGNNGIREGFHYFLHGDSHGGV